MKREREMSREIEDKEDEMRALRATLGWHDVLELVYYLL